MWKAKVRLVDGMGLLLAQATASKTDRQQALSTAIVLFHGDPEYLNQGIDVLHRLSNPQDGDRVFTEAEYAHQVPA